MEILGRKFEGPLDVSSKDLPDATCAYILIKGDEKIFTPLYVGRTISLRKRIMTFWGSSNLGEYLADGIIDKVLYCEFGKDEKEELAHFEHLLMEHYKPKLHPPIHYKIVNNASLRKMKELEKISAKRSAYSASLIALIFSVLTLILTSYYSKESYVSKNTLQGNIITALQNDADLRAVKHIYVNRVEIRKGIFNIFNPKENVYLYSTPFSNVLEEIRTNMFNKDGDKALLKKVDSMIEQHIHINPFDRLEPIQRDYFENIKIKLDTEYSDVIIEVNKIADELHNKNTLVDKYLKDSNTSFWVSVFALMFSVLVSSYQIFNGRASRMQRLFAESLSKVVNEDENKDA